MPIVDPVSDTSIFILVFAAALVIGMRPREPNGFSVPVVGELKGFAILAIVFGHVGYFLFADHRFLFPLSTIAGVGVDLFLLVSGFGLAASALKTARTPLDFYKRRMDKLFLPLWLSLGTFFVLDFFVLGKSYSFAAVLGSFAGWIPTADIYADVNSPLWYITLSIFFYLVFPFLFSARRPLISASLVFCAGYALHYLTLPFLSGVSHLHELHLWAFPLGVLIAGFLQGRTIEPIRSPFLYYGALLGCTAVFSYFVFNSNIGAGVFAEQGTSILTALSVCMLFVIKKFEIRLLSLFGLFSYEIYLFHWPIMYRYDVFFGFLPSWLALSLYLVLFVLLGWCLQTLTKRLFDG